MHYFTAAHQSTHSICRRSRLMQTQTKSIASLVSRHQIIIRHPPSSLVRASFALHETDETNALRRIQISHLSHISPIVAESITNTKKWHESSSPDLNSEILHYSSNPTKVVDVTELTRQLLSNRTGNTMTEIVKTLTEEVRANEPFLRSLRLSPPDAKSMFLLPPDLLKDVHFTVSHFSKYENSRGIILDLPDGKKNKIPGPVLCVMLLELIGIPHYYNSMAKKLGPSPVLPVHSSQIDQILHCCLQTVLSLSKNCKTGKGSLIGYNFNFSGNWQSGSAKTAAQVAEEIWQSVWSMEIVFTHEVKAMYSNPPAMQMPSLLSKINAFQGNAVLAYVRPEDSNTQTSLARWSKKDKRRHKQAVSLFNSTLAAYARLGSSASGIHQELRRDMVQSAERMLLELASKNNAVKPSPSTILQCIRPDVISFNTAMNAWSQLSPGRKGSRHDEHTTLITTLTAERTQAILETMQELFDEERAALSTTETMEIAWEEQGDAELLQSHAVFPNTSSYNTVLNAWSRTSSSDSIDKAMRVFQTMIDRCNSSCTGRASMIRQNSHMQRTKSDSLEQDNAYPDSRTFVALLGCCSNMRSRSFNESVEMLERIRDIMTHWEEHLQWSAQQSLPPAGGQTKSILNIFAYNALIKAFSSISKSSWHESLLCCHQIDDLISQMNAVPDAITLGIAINAWINCADFANGDEAKTALCVQKACGYLDSMLSPEIITSQHDSSIASSRVVHAMNDVIAFCGKSFMPAKANELFLRAKELGIYNLTTTSAAVNALAQSKGISHVQQALDHVLDLEKDTSVKHPLSISSKKRDYTWMYNACIAGFINTDQYDGCVKAHNLLLHMLDSHARNPRHIGRPNTTSFALVMDALAQRGKSAEVKALLIKMEKLSHQRNNSPRGRGLDATVDPNIIHYNTLITSCVRSGDSEDIELAKELFSRMNNDSNIPSPDAITNSLMLQLSGERSDDKNSKAGPEMPRNIAPHTISDISTINIDDLILDTISQNPNTSSKSFNAIMKSLAYSCSIEGANKATALLHKLEEMHAAGEIEFRPDVILYNLALNAWQGCEQSNSEVATINPPEKAEEILDLLCQYHNLKNSDISPNDASFSICIHSWCKSSEPDAAHRAERILRRKESFLDEVDDLTIRRTDYNSILSKWKDSLDEGPEHATNLFEDMMRKSKESGAYQNPDEFSFNTLLAVYAKSNDDKGAEKAEEQLRQMNQLFDEKKTNIQPGMISYRTVMNAYIGRKAKETPRKVEELVDEMIGKYKLQGRDDLRPDSSTLDLILKACNLVPETWADEVANNEVIEIANRTFTKLRGKNELKVKPTHSTYAFMFRIFNRHMDFTDPRYDLLMKNLWTQCCRDGLVSEFTLESFRLSVKESIFFKCIGDENRGKNAERVKLISLPHDWRRNVAAKRKSNAG